MRRGSSTCTPRDHASAGSGAGLLGNDPDPNSLGCPGIVLEDVQISGSLARR
jgi:hypothetical protein